MQKNRGLRSRSNPDRQPFTTIDDALEKAQELASMLGKLAEHKHPLAVRRGRGERKEVKSVREDRESKQMKGAGRTYFFDVEKTREGKRYLRITESRKGKEEEWERSTINVFPEDAEEFADALAEMAAKL